MLSLKMSDARRFRKADSAAAAGAGTKPGWIAGGGRKDSWHLKMVLDL